MAAVPKPIRQWIIPAPDDSWESIAARVLPQQPTADAVAALHSWNPHILFRPSPGLLCSDVVFVEASTGE